MAVTLREVENCARESARKWIQWNIPNGSTLKWGSPTKVYVSVLNLEKLAEYVAIDIATKFLDEEIFIS